MTAKMSCAGCANLDEYFGDCCHPKLTFKEAVEKCAENGYMFKTDRHVTQRPEYRPYKARVAGSNPAVPTTRL